MGYDTHKQTGDYKSESAISNYTKLGVRQKTSKSRMIFGLGAQALGSTMMRCIERYQSDVEMTGPNTHD